ncbi:YfjI family protein [Methylobacterium isbiliense]|uniref:DUF3987 domain-containing protein n=1 Tax=Methylobacterium isbiliense TaxID=315478 RepID=A0ABQ4SMI5_9HYPH|nr:YfjI family protein [Methylobacterium isbiliense]MDN3627769.1 YfjI family protein [Methylobacterium isbiliense]GJE04365.1 hypothetical protein GMJLKIPL_6326 [Methylobacterium isbiliense]
MRNIDPFAEEMAELGPELNWPPYNDAPHRDQPRRCTTGNSQLTQTEKLPLFPPLPPAEPYPVEALGPILADAAAVIARKVQVPDAIAAQSVLSAASLAAQAHADVLLPYGQSRPLSIYIVTIASSGDRKSTADNEALWPIRRREETLHLYFKQEFQGWLVTHAAWTAEKRRIEADRKLGFENRKIALAALGPEPETPLRPVLTSAEPTFEGLVKSWSDTPAALGVFTSEGGQFTGGHAMSAENRLRTAAGFSVLWDGQPVTRMRALDGVTILRGRRLAMHLMIQPGAAAEFLADPVLRDQGLLSRVLVAAPDSIAGTRRYRRPVAEDEVFLRAYHARILALLEAPWPLSGDRAKGLQPRPLRMIEAAEDLWRDFYDRIEERCAPNGDLRPVRDFAAKAAEHAARIAGVLTVIADERAVDIDPETIRRALRLTSWYVEEVVRLHRSCRPDPALLRAQALLDWLGSRNEAETKFSAILQLGPGPTRTKKEAEAAIDVLKVHGWVAESSQRPRTIRLIPGGSSIA